MDIEPSGRPELAFWDTRGMMRSGLRGRSQIRGTRWPDPRAGGGAAERGARSVRHTRSGWVRADRKSSIDSIGLRRCTMRWQLEHSSIRSSSRVTVSPDSASGWVWWHSMNPSPRRPYRSPKSRSHASHARRPVDLSTADFFRGTGIQLARIAVCRLRLLDGEPPNPRDRYRNASHSGGI
jgi:hypothetical protein